MGVSFLNSHCAAPACGPSRAALFSGLRPSTSGCYHNHDPWKQHIPEGISLNASFKKAGYRVMGTGKTYHSSANGLKTVYESEWDEYPTLARSSTGGASKYQGFFTPLPIDIKDEDLGDWHSVNYCIEQLNKKQDKPFFLACGMIKPHLPWAVPRKYYDMFPLDSIELPPHLDSDFDDIPEAGQKMGVRTDHPQFLVSGRWKNAVQSYLATIAYVDICIGRLLDALETSEFRENTIIVLWGDHGWHLGEKQRWRKFSLWEEATRTPMIWYVPGVTKANALCSRPVDYMSIYPTLCELAGIKIPSHVEGKSILPLLKKPEAKWDDVALCTNGYGNHAVRTERWRYIRYANGDEELYDHSKDEYEWKNLAANPEYAAVKKELSIHIPKKEKKPNPKPKPAIKQQEEKTWSGKTTDSRTRAF
jgi:arylsulfatase A-like enzyme